MADITDYINFNTDIDVEKLSDVEQRIRLLMRERYPEVDTSDGSPFGNLVLTPICRVIALFEESVDCILSDLNLENAINNIVCDCDFIQNFLLGLGVQSLTEVNTTSVARFVFNTNKEYTFDQGQPLLFNDEYIFNIVGGTQPTIQVLAWDETNKKPSVPKDNGIQIHNAKFKNIYSLSVSAISGSSNTAYASEYFVDIPIYGPAAANLTQGTLASIDEDFPNFENIISVELLEEVTPLELPTNIGELAKLCQSIAPSSNLTTKAGVRSYIYNKYPKTVGASPVTSGDAPEMIRDTTNDYSITQPKLDIYVKNNMGGATPLQCSEIIGVEISRSVSGNQTTFTLIYKGSYRNGNSDDLNKLILQHTPVLFRSITFPTSESNTAYPLLISPARIGNFFTQSKLAPDNTDLGYTQDSMFEFKAELVVNTKTENNATTFDSSNDMDEDTYNFLMTWFDVAPTNPFDYFIHITYDYDPLAEAVSKYIASPAVEPFIDTLVRPFKTAYVAELKIVYRKDASRFFDRQQAMDDVYKFVNSITYPTTYDDGYLGDIMITNGATGIDEISAKVYYQASAAHKYYTEQNNDADAFQFEQDMSLYVPKATAQAPFMNQFGLGTRNINYILDRENINLVEKVI